MSCVNVTLPGMVSGQSVGALCCPERTVYWVGGIVSDVADGVAYPCEGVPMIASDLVDENGSGLFWILMAAAIMFFVFVVAMGATAFWRRPCCARTSEVIVTPDLPQTGGMLESEV